MNREEKIRIINQKLEKMGYVPPRSAGGGAPMGGGGMPPMDPAMMQAMAGGMGGGGGGMPPGLPPQDPSMIAGGGAQAGSMPPAAQTDPAAMAGGMPLAGTEGVPGESSGEEKPKRRNKRDSTSDKTVGEIFNRIVELESRQDALEQKFDMLMGESPVKQSSAKDKTTLQAIKELMKNG